MKKHSKSKIDLKKEILFLSLNQKGDKIDFQINCQSSFPSQFYGKEFSLNDLQKISKYFQLFDSIDECFTDLKQKFEFHNYEINLNEIEEKIILKIITNIAKKDFNLEIPIKKTEQEKTYSTFLYSGPYKKNNNIYGSYGSYSSYSSYNNFDDEESSTSTSTIKTLEKFDRYLEKKLHNFENSLELITNENGSKKNILFEKSTIIENDNERQLLENFIKENDKTKININPILLFKSSVDGDDSQKFHQKCDFRGATITLVRSETGRRFGGYNSLSWDKNLGNYLAKGDNFLFSFDTRKYYKNISNANHSYHNGSYGPTFGGGHDLYISHQCMSNQNSYSSKSNYDMSSSYELNGGTQKFKVLDYEVFQI